MRPKNKFGSQGESIQDSCKTSNDVRCRDLGSEESTREEVGCGGKMRMLRWMSGVTKLDRIRNERIRGTTKVGEISKKVQESRLKWYGHVLRREDEYVGKRVMAMEVPGNRRRGRPKRRWLYRTCLYNVTVELHINAQLTLFSYMQLYCNPYIARRNHHSKLIQSPGLLLDPLSPSPLIGPSLAGNPFGGKLSCP